MMKTSRSCNAAHWSNLAEAYSIHPISEVFPEDIFLGDERVKLENAGVTSNEVAGGDNFIQQESFQANEYGPPFPTIDDEHEYPEPLTPDSPKLPAHSLHCGLMPSIALPHVINPSSEEIPGEYNFRLTLETQPKKVANPDWIYSCTQNKLYIKPQTQCPMKFSVAGCLPPGTFIRAVPIFKLPEHAKDIVRCCPNHTLLEQNNRDHPASTHFIRSDNPQAEYEQCVQTNRLSVRIPFTAPQGSDNEDTTIHENFSFICNNSCGGLNRRAIQIVFTLEIGGSCEVLGRCAMEARVCACPGRDSKQDNEAVSRPGRKKRKISSDVSSSTSISPFSANDICPSPSQTTEDNTVYNLKVCGYVNFLILRKIAFALEFFANMKTKITDLPTDARDLPDLFGDLTDEQPFPSYDGERNSVPIPRPIPHSSSIMTDQQSVPSCASSTNSAQVGAWYRAQSIPSDIADGSAQSSSYMGCYTYRRVTLAVDYTEHAQSNDTADLQ